MDMIKFTEHLGSSRFLYVQEGLLVGLIGAFAKVVWTGFPIIELFGFIGPIIGLAFGLKTYGDIQTEKTIAKANRKKADDAEDDDIPVR
jgi:xanthosine utilization system XapX-like protein